MNASLNPIDAFAPRHIGPNATDIENMLEAIGRSSLDDLCDYAVPATIRYQGDLSASCGEALSETEALAHLRSLVGRSGPR